MDLMSIDKLDAGVSEFRQRRRRGGCIDTGTVGQQHLHRQP